MIYSYAMWLAIVSLLCLGLERIKPWRSGQAMWRPQLSQDLIWLVLNGHYFGIAISKASTYLGAQLAPDFFAALRRVEWLETWPLLAQALGWFVVKDFCEWCVHNLLHRMPVLWRVHKLHHSIEHMDWIGNFRFHCGESVIYQTLTYLPLVVLGVDGPVLLAIAVLGTLIGHLNHSNLNLTWGPLRLLLNSPRMHIWHHASAPPSDRPYGCNFGICLSLWDWIFGTAHWPSQQLAPTQQPVELGFSDIDTFPKSFLGRLAYPFIPVSKRASIDAHDRAPR